MVLHDIDFSDLRESIDNAVASAVEGWAELPAATQESLMQTVQMAQECGVQIPEGLAGGIASGEITSAGNRSAERGLLKEQSRAWQKSPIKRVSRFRKKSSRN